MPSQFEELYGVIRQSRSVSPDYQKYLEAMEALNREMKALMEPDEKGWKLLNQERMERLARCYRQAGSCAEVYLHKTRDTEDPGERQLLEKVRELQALMAEDTAALRRYNPRSEREMKSLPTILEESRIPVMDQGSKQIKSVGGAQSSRIPMTIIGPDGKPMPGMFTKAQVFDPLGDINRIIAAAAQKTGPDGKALLNGFMEAYRAYYAQNPDNLHPVKDNPAMVLNFLLNCRKPGAKAESMSMSADRILSEIAKVRGRTPEEIKNALGKDALKALGSGMERIVFDVSIKASEVKMTEGTRIDRKNAGMSTVAELLGIGGVVCHARPMKLKGPNGEIVDGTFMAMAEGVDPMHPGRDGHLVDYNRLKDSDGRALESIADLQVLDYLCGNIDRHGYNLFYGANMENGFYGVQGIDNDSSFGLITDQKTKTRRMPMPNTMGVISKTTADRVMKLSGAELAFSLRGLVEEEAIDSATWRLAILKQYIAESRKKLDANKKDIKYPYIRELETADFGKVDLKKLAAKDKNNHFCEIKRVAPRIASSAQAANEGKKDPAAIGSENRATEAGVYGQVLKAKELRKLLSDRTSFWHGSSSGNYTEIESALKAYQTEQEKLARRLKTMGVKAKGDDPSPKAQVEQYVTRFDIQRMQKSLLQVKDAADKYAREKRAELANQHKRLEDEPYAKARIEAAEQISKFAEKSQTLSAEEKEFLASNERRALEQIARTANAAQAPAAQPGNRPLQNEAQPGMNPQNDAPRQEGPVRNSGPAAQN